METVKISRTLDEKLRFDPASEIERICAFIHSEVQRRGVRGVVIGLSGGLDSTTCAYLSARCLPAAQIHLFSLPERDSSPTIRDNAHSAARELNLPLEVRDLSELLEWLGVYKDAPREVAGNRRLLERSIKIVARFGNKKAFFPWAQEYAFGRRRGLLASMMRWKLWPYAVRSETFIFGKVRARMLVLAIQAMQMDCLLICTTDRSELSVGFYDPHGDGVGDIAPLCHLYKTQIRVLARVLGVSDEILTQPSSGDLAAGLPNEVAMGLKYEQLDRVLAGLSLGMDDGEVAVGAAVQRSIVKSIRLACDLADERRRFPTRLEALG